MSSSLNQSKCEASFFSVDLHQDNFQLHFFLFNFTLRFNATTTFLGVTFDRSLFFSSHVFSLKATFFTRLKALRCISASSWGSSKELFELLYKAFLRFVLYHASSEWFPFLAVTNVNKLKRLSRMACCANNGCLLSFFISLLSEASLPLYESL